MQQQRDELAADQLRIRMHRAANTHIDNLACESNLADLANRCVEPPPPVFHRDQLAEAPSRISAQPHLLENHSCSQESTEAFGAFPHVKVLLRGSFPVRVRARRTYLKVPRAPPLRVMILQLPIAFLYGARGPQFEPKQNPFRGLCDLLGSPQVIPSNFVD